jgi:hypothetical protein
LVFGVEEAHPLSEFGGFVVVEDTSCAGDFLGAVRVGFLDAGYEKVAVVVAAWPVACAELNLE